MDVENPVFENDENVGKPTVTFEDTGSLKSQSKKPAPVAPVRKTKTSAESVHYGTLDQDQPAPSVPFDANMYATKKSFSKGCLNIAVLTSNTTTLKFMLQLEKDEQNNLYYPIIVVLSLSILVQVVTAIMCLTVGNHNINHEGKARDQAKKINNGISALTLLTTIINILVTSLGVGEMNHTPNRNVTGT